MTSMKVPVRNRIREYNLQSAIWPRRTRLINMHVSLYNGPVNINNSGIPERK